MTTKDVECLGVNISGHNATLWTNTFAERRHYANGTATEVGAAPPPTHTDGVEKTLGCRPPNLGL